jgi:hypothetical protein
MIEPVNPRDAIWVQEPPSQWIPVEYQGWLFLIFIAIAVVALSYGFYLIATDENLKFPTRKIR